MSNSRNASSVLTLGSANLDGYSGRVEIVSLRKRTVLNRVLRRPQQYKREICYANVVGGVARCWRY